MLHPDLKKLFDPELRRLLDGGNTNGDVQRHMEFVDAVYGFTVDGCFILSMQDGRTIKTPPMAHPRP